MLQRSKKYGASLRLPDRRFFKIRPLHSLVEVILTRRQNINQNITTYVFMKSLLK